MCNLACEMAKRLVDIKEEQEFPNGRWLEESLEGNAEDGLRAISVASNPFWKLRRKNSGRTLDDLTEQEGKVKDKAIREKRQFASDTAEGSGRDPIARIAALEGKENICTADSQNMLRENHSDKESLPKTLILSPPVPATPTPPIKVSSGFKDFLELKAVECKTLRVYAVCKGLPFQDASGFPAAANALPRRRPWSAYAGTFQPRCLLVHEGPCDDSGQRSWLKKFGGDNELHLHDRWCDQSKRLTRMVSAKHPANEFEELWLHSKRLQLMELQPLPLQCGIGKFNRQLKWISLAFKLKNRRLSMFLLSNFVFREGCCFPA